MNRGDGDHRGTGDVFDMWAKDENAPDVTDGVMRRLGYERVTTAEGTRDRRRRVLNRAVGVLLLAGVAAIGVHLQQAERQVRRAELPSFDRAIPQSVERSSDTIGGAAKTIRNIIEPSVGDESRRRGQDGKCRGAKCRGDGSRVRWSGLL